MRCVRLYVCVTHLYIFDHKVRQYPLRLEGLGQGVRPHDVVGEEGLVVLQQGLVLTIHGERLWGVLGCVCWVLYISVEC